MTLLYLFFFFMALLVLLFFRCEVDADLTAFFDQFTRGECLVDCRLDYLATVILYSKVRLDELGY